jgi:methionyl-tRNA formyltransferase
MTEDELAPLRKIEPDLLLVGGFSIILKPSLLELPRTGCVNCHSSLLPRHRGPNPFAAAIRAADEHSGVTFHIMEPGIDTGDILDQVAFPLQPEETAISLYKASCDQAANLVVNLMDRIEREGLHGEPQDPNIATYEKKPTVEDAWVDWNLPAEEIHRLVRAISPSPMPRFRFRERVVLIARTAYDDKDSGKPAGTVIRSKRPAKIATGRGTLTLLLALSPTPLPWFWPSNISTPEVGEMLPGDEE